MVVPIRTKIFVLSLSENVAFEKAFEKDYWKFCRKLLFSKIGAGNNKFI